MRVYDLGMNQIGRRDFVALVAIAPAAAAELRFFSAEEAKWLDALMALIIPTDEFPGAREAGCLEYLDLQLREGLQRFGPSYRQGLQEFQRSQPGFLELTPEEQNAVLTKLEGSSFFEMVVDHTMQGFYGSPVHGGNRDEASWKMMGIEKFMGGGHWHGA